MHRRNFLRGLVAVLTAAPVLKELVFSKEIVPEEFVPWRGYTEHIVWSETEVILNPHGKLVPAPVYTTDMAYVSEEAWNNYKNAIRT